MDQEQLLLSIGVSHWLSFPIAGEILQNVSLDILQNVVGLISNIEVSEFGHVTAYPPDF